MSVSLIAVLTVCVSCASGAGGSSQFVRLDRPQPQVTAQAPLASDGCTWFPEGSWHACCVQHDERYFIGGSLRQKLAADRGLASCVSRGGHPLVGGLMFIGTQFGGMPWLPTPFRWGFGAGRSLPADDAARLTATPVSE